MLHSMCQQIWKTQLWPQDWKWSICIPIAKKGNTNKYSDYWTVALISHHSKVMFKIIQVSLQHYMNWELPDVQARFRKDKRTRGQIANICWNIEKTKDLQKKTSTSVSLTMLKPLTMLIIKHCGKFLKSWEYQTILAVSWETCIQVKKQKLEYYMKQLTGSKLRKEYYKAVYCHPVYLTYTLSTSCEMSGWRRYKLESRLLGEILTASDMQMVPL